MIKEYFLIGVRGLRTYRNTPTFLITVLLVSAVGVGSVTALFCVINALLLRPLPYAEADQLVVIWQTGTAETIEWGAEHLPVSYGDFTELNETETVFGQIAGLDQWAGSLTGVENPERLVGARVSVNFFSLLGVKPLLGRTFISDDEIQGQHRVAVLTHNFWRRQFGGNQGIVGQTITINERPFQVVGVLPEDFRFTQGSNLSAFKFSKRTDLFIPLLLGEMKNNRGFRGVGVIARLKPGVSVAQAKAEMNIYASRMAEKYPDTNKNYGMKVVPLQEQTAGAIKSALFIVWAATGCVMLIVCANLAFLLLARITARRKEMAVRLVLGADRPKIIGQLLSESLILSLLGGALGLVVAYFGIRLLINMSPYGALKNNPVVFDIKVFAFALIVSVLTGAIIGLLPAFQSSKINLNEQLKEGAHGSQSRVLIAMKALIITETALTIVLLMVAGIAVNSYISLLRENLGFQAKNITTFDLNLPFNRYREAERKTPFFQQTIDRIKALPEVAAVGMNYALPFSGINPSNAYVIEGQEPSDPNAYLSANLGLINPDYFKTLNIPLLNGRHFNDQDTPNSSPVVIIDERLAEKHFPNESPLGKRLKIGGMDGLTIVGVVGSVKHEAYEDKPLPYVYQPYTQRAYLETSMAVRGKTENQAALITAVRGAVKSIDNNLPISNVSTLQQSYLDAVANQRYSMTLLIIFACVALLLTITGIYGIMHYSTVQRTREIGIRMALGANGRDVVNLCLKQAVFTAMIGLGIGLVASWWIVKPLLNAVYGKNSLNPFVALVVAIVILTAAILAGYFPSKRASKIEPVTVLRMD